MVRTGESSAERTLIRTIAGAQRPLDEDLNLTSLKAIDKLQNLNEKFREQWIHPSPWLVLEDCWVLPANMPVAKMLEDIEQHGKPIGIVGAALLKFSNKYAILRMMFRKDEKSRKTIDASAQAALDDLNRRIRAVFTGEVFIDPNEDTLSIYYSFHPNNRPEPGSKRVGTLAYLTDGQIRMDFDRKNKQFADVMEQAKERFLNVVKKLQEIQATEKK